MLGFFYVIKSTIEELDAFLRREATAVVPVLSGTGDGATPATDNREQTGEMAATDTALVSASAGPTNGMSEQ